MRPTIDLYWIELPVYTAWVGLGVAVGLSIAALYLRTRSRRLSQPDRVLYVALWVFLAAWVGARAYHVLTRWDYYSTRPAEIAQWGALLDGAMPGGLGIRGACMAGLIALALYAAWGRLAFWHLADAAALGLSVGQAIGWAGALAQGANYGLPSDSRFAMELPDLYGLYAPRFPLQHAEIVLFALVFAGLVGLAAQKRAPGTLFCVYLVVVSLANFALGFQRGDETAHWGTLRVDQIVDAAGVGFGLAVGLGRWLSERGKALRILQGAINAGDVGAGQ